MRFWPVLVLLVLAPWVGEYLLGNVPVQRLPLLPFLVPLYGCGALLVREVARRTGRGWPSIFLLATAYGVIEAGLVDQSLFNQTFEGLDQAGVTPVPWVGVSAYHAFAFLIGHTVWSIGVPIALVELWFPARRTEPWLGWFGLSVTVVVYLFGCWLIFRDLREQEGFLAAPHQLAVAAAAAVLLVALAFLLPRPRPVSPVSTLTAGNDEMASGRRLPPPWVVGVVTFVTAGLHAAASESWLGFGLDVVVVAAAAVGVARLARRPSWGDRHLLGLLAGALLTYAWLGFVLTAFYGPGDRLRLFGNVLFTLAAVLLLVVTRWVIGRRELRPAGPREGVSERQVAAHGR
ncbi:hypothetical protein [Asanoa iriomotensis]|uniref:DUF998 domain-containing protein n=1 Tax=Asanoa iriomotensis TaxID=234613 RepID=A0ABQ4BV44_9ACTN|nr:hypothetical protein [Asanoa iriomotensis]GIF54390.1 hypothetical protein Air01nite_04850 [Asanoa iriomotensis]